MIRTREFKAGQVIFRENDRGETAFLIEQGRVEIVKTSGDQEVHIAFINPNEPFGEMSMIDEKPRSATAIAVEDTTVRELHREDFLENLKFYPNIALNLLRLLFARLREADATILQLSKSLPPPAAPPPPPQNSQFWRDVDKQEGELVVTLRGLTAEARGALPEDAIRITRFPFRIGRKCTDELTHNDLALEDNHPYQISSQHISIIKAGNRIGVADRGSTMGSILDGRAVGGAGVQTTTVFLSKPETTLVLGDHNSPYQFQIDIGFADA